ncbi:methylenetetrahydrofolate--tRNA-(uracil-5-)-methyltransferase [Salsuginibacillus halophilus]|uniref:Methylenetetrahydrofolate--tRNA-(uracil-5-)-methyltransferase TrmFO n=1 Tax=Salsuginibacillus halophilus TaxID=517424 RepID=A0A2P8HY97_9BACI|nr:FADH(2)-oxidizing methylenetetrahydrofolate--tRNA-(uracil(54)-C(5))-methyltransferase TrmFO [Salsuginibacillus halophilus]PSL51179.1 methylenetetrahydrofolate--tRNA-(uracil-5-)-methyltransferase [Salsuginibacillus halophilus]
MSQTTVHVIGAGLAGSEATWQLAKEGHHVHLYEMRPNRQTPAHHTDKFAELVCSNSLRANALSNAVGVLKEEMRHLDSIIIQAADQASVPAGGALAVDRHEFAAYVTEHVKNHPNVTVHNEEITEIPEEPTIIATGPLTTDGLSGAIREMTGEEYLYFYDAAAPIIETDSIDMNRAYLKSRYDKGEAAYINCPMTKEEFDNFYDALMEAERVPMKEFEKDIFFEGCMPVEVMAERGRKTLLFGPMKPVGLEHPETGETPYAVVQLRQDNQAGTLYNIVGFQTHMKWGPQKEVVRIIPGLENADIVRYGVMHRNTFINSPRLLEPTYQSKQKSNVFFAGQITGVEGYVESAAAGLMAGINAGRYASGEPLTVFPEETMHGAIANYITTANPDNFQPMNVNFGLLPRLEEKIKNKKERNEKLAERAIASLETFTRATYA